MSGFYQCATCRRIYAVEGDIRAHQDRFNALHAVDPEIDEHDGEPWVMREIVVGQVFIHGREQIVVSRIDADLATVPAPWAQQRHAITLDMPDGLVALINGTCSADEQQVRVFAAALDACGIDPDHDEVSLAWHLDARYSHWYAREDLGRFAVEVAYVQTTMTALAVSAARRSR